MANIEKTRHLLLVFPHPDDESFGKAGTVILFTKAGTPATLICGTLGEMGRNMGNPIFANRETLPSIRRRELEDACQALGVDDLRLLGLRDKTVEFEDPERVADRIEAVIREVKPTILMTYYPKYGVHPDHDAMSHAAVIAVKRLPKEERPVIWGSAVVNDAESILGEPDFVLDVSSVLEQKMAAMRAHKSQYQGMFSRMEEALAQGGALRDEVVQQLTRERFWIYRIQD
ncbi:bacillithiol biosynthesis deacetylase BshB2 [Alicyclobacillus sacchari]|uniref:Bacillithiol biosynthesis deacetylase BshB2 n=1 Tax=Alicyclobacillus sacchari TaxID=392010 RepID=A0A4V6QD30_9BACL|nr:bacillithiol biosynthesis deacetylase BshB2 [Alicyclobacillus sacchari]TDY49671.1 bacillithiol biosynthesis deacetylase BshB2 [Alicyclobacillus sacchari]GMA58422.1 putative N-acetyl-alpha-D-glucosaminyl L-malate deacetylase 2 [Alicyclobacillus sacchari]